MKISFEGIGQIVATFAMASGVEAGMAVAVTADGTVGKGTAGAAPCGVVLAAREDSCAVQVGGFVRVAYTGTAPTVGYGTIGLDGNGGIKTVSTGGLTCLIAQVDTDGKTAVIKL